MHSLVGLLSLFLFLYSSSDASTDCLESLHDVELSLKSNSYNLESIDYGFFTPNRKSPFLVTVNYYFNTSTSAHDEISIHPAAFEAQYIGSPYCNDPLVPDLQFYWIGLPLFYYIDPSIMEVLSDALHIHTEKTRRGSIHIVIPPICGDNPAKDRWILNTITTKLQQFSSVDSRYKSKGFSKFVSQDNSSNDDWTAANTTCNSLIIFDDNQSHYGDMIVLIVVLSQYMLCFSVMYLHVVPVILQKYFGLLPKTKSVATNINHPKFSFFWGFTISFLHLEFFPELIHIYRLNDFSWYAIFLLFPVPSVVLFLIPNCLYARNCYNQIPNKDAHPRTFRFLYILTSAILSLCLQKELFYIGWLALTVVAFPTTIAALSFKIVWYIATSLSVTAAIANSITGFKTSKAESTSTCSCGTIFAYSIIVSGIPGIIFAYLVTLSTAGMDYHDGITAIMPSLTPILIIGFITWIVGRSRVTNIMWSQATDGLLEYKEEEKKSLLDGQDE